MYHYLYERNKDYLNNNAIEYFGTELTYGELIKQIDICASALFEHGVREGDIISICTLTMPETVYLLYGANKIGAVCNMIGLNSSIEDLNVQLKLTESKYLFVVEMAYEKLIEASIDTDVKMIVSIPLESSMPLIMRKIVSLKNKHPKLRKNDKNWNEFIKPISNENVREENKGKALAIIEYTGGTTGVPKGVMISNNAANAYAAHYGIHYNDSNTVFDIMRKHKFLNVLPPFLSFGTFACTHMPLSLGVQVILFPDPSPEKMPDLIIKYRPNHFCCGPLHIDAIMNNKKIQSMDLSFVLSMIYGGEKVNDEWKDAVNLFLMEHSSKYHVINGYGMTETASAVCVVPHKYDVLIPYAKNNLKIVDTEKGVELPYGKEGEICISSPSLMSGYYKEPDETEKVLFYENGEKWLHTGDLGVISENGSISITGRLKRIYWCKRDGMVVRVYPMRIEEIICRLGFVDKCTVIGKKDNEVGYRSIAFVILADKKIKDNNMVIDQITDYCRKNLPANHIPDEYVFVNSFPLTRAGKVDYRELEKMANENYNL